MRTLARKSWRDFTRARWPMAGLAVLVALAAALALGALRARAVLTASLDTCLERLNAADLEVLCSPTLPGAVDKAADLDVVRTGDERMVFDGRLRHDGDASRAARVQVLPDEARPEIYALEILEGRWPRPGEEALLVDRSVRKIQGIDVGARVSLEILGVRRTLPVVGITNGSEHVLFPVHPDFDVPIPGALAVVYASAAAAKAYPYADRVNSLLFRLRAGADVTAARAAILDVLGVAVTAVLTEDETPSHRVGRNALTIYGIYMPTAVGVLLAVSLVLYLIILSRVVHRQRRSLGTLLAIGQRRLPVAFSLLPMAVVPTLVGCVLGILAHGGVAHSIVEAHQESLGWAAAVDAGTGPEAGWALALALAVAVLGCLLPAGALLCRSVPDLLRPSTRRVFARPTGRLAGVGRTFAHKLRLPMCALLGLRTVVRRRWISGITALALGANFALVMAFLFVHYSHTVESKAAFERFGLTGVAYFSEPQSEADLRAAADPAWTERQPIITSTVWVEFPRGPAFVTLACLEPDSWIARYEVAEGRPVGSGPRDAVHVDRWLADVHDLAVGDRITIYPSYSAPEGTVLEVAGIFDGVSLGFAVVTLETGRALFGLPQMATGLHVQSAQPRETLIDALQDLPSVQSVVHLDDARRYISDTFAGARFIITLALFFAVMTAVVFLGILASLDAAERVLDLAVLRALGWRDRAIFGLHVTEVSLRGLLALLLALPAAPLLANWMLRRIQEANGYRLPLHDPAWVYLLVTGIALLCMPLGALPAVRAARALPSSQVVRLLGSE